MMCFVWIMESLGVFFLCFVMILIVFLFILWELLVNVIELFWIGLVVYLFVYVVIILVVFGIVLLVVVGLKLLGLEFNN